ncbi:hypothetical protein F4809DRAFT_596652 [Biscogniauxia mediterranea]|nr:hypothetical protein F4809DRAFT_596652 [Biscogniauxia mediterranea]
MLESLSTCRLRRISLVGLWLHIQRQLATLSIINGHQDKQMKRKYKAHNQIFIIPREDSGSKYMMQSPFPS